MTRPTPGWKLHLEIPKQKMKASFDVIDFKDLGSKLEDRDELVVHIRVGPVDLMEADKVGDIASDLAVLEWAVKERSELSLVGLSKIGGGFTTWKKGWIERIERFKTFRDDDFVFVLKFLLVKECRVNAAGGPFPVPGLICERCGATEGVAMESSRTARVWDGKGEDPNGDVAFCRPCAKEHHEEWDERWKEYYSGLI